MINYDKAFALPNEVWEDVRGYKGLYKVSTMGRVKSLERILNDGRLWKEKILKSYKNKQGYLYVFLSKNGIEKRYYVHRLVAQAFVSNPDNKPEVNHRDEVKTSNHYSNLEFCNRKYNNNYGTARQRATEKLSKTVYQYTLEGKLVKEWLSGHEVQRQTGFAQSHINDCCKDKLKTAYGFKWSYEKNPEQ